MNLKRRYAQGWNTWNTYNDQPRSFAGGLCSEPRRKRI